MNCALMKTHGQSHVDLQLWPNQQFFLIFMNNAFLFWLHLHTFMMEISSIMPMLASVNSWLILRDLIFIHLKNKEFVFLNDSCVCVELSRCHIIKFVVSWHCACSVIIIQTAIFVPGHVMQDEKDESFAHQWPWRDLGFWQAFPWPELVLSQRHE